MSREEMETADAILQAEIKQLIAEAPSVTVASIAARFALPLAWCGVVVAMFNLFQ